MTRRTPIALAAIALAVAVHADTGGEKPVARSHAAHPPAPERQSAAQARAKSAGCTTCHSATDRHTMHQNPAVVLGCTDCHGGDAMVEKPAGAQRADAAYQAACAMWWGAAGPMHGYLKGYRDWLVQKYVPFYQQQDGMRVARPEA